MHDEETENPYSAPGTSTHVPEVMDATEGPTPAERGIRFAGALIDWMIWFAATIPAGIILSTRTEAGKPIDENVMTDFYLFFVAPRDIFRK
jgi:hypothetical protein